MHLNFTRAFGITLATLAIWMVLSAVSFVIYRITRPPVPVQPHGLLAMELAENREMEQLIEDASFTRQISFFETQSPVLPDTPAPRYTRLYNNLLDNLLSGLHYYYRVDEDTPLTTIVTSWDADTGLRVLGDEFYVSLETNLNYLITLEKYRRMHSKAVFDEDLEFIRNRVDTLFEQEWHTVMDIPL
ncbi:MAG TPA: hypothetical protein ENN67_01450, partial [Firmicutes bacterium]|nr:hypothetical protein [Bacillota bacterium]